MRAPCAHACLYVCERGWARSERRACPGTLYSPLSKTCSALKAINLLALRCDYAGLRKAALQILRNSLRVRLLPESSTRLEHPPLSTLTSLPNARNLAADPPCLGELRVDAFGKAEASKAYRAENRFMISGFSLPPSAPRVADHER